MKVLFSKPAQLEVDDDSALFIHEQDTVILRQ